MTKLIQKVPLLGLVIALLLTLLPAAPTMAAPAPSPALLNQIDAYVAQQVAESGIPGVAYAILAGDEILVAKGVGVSDLKAKTAVTPDVLYDIASVTKVMTATAVLQLWERGQLDLDAPIQRYLPWFRTATEERTGQITVRNLLTHTTGFEPGELSEVLWKDPAGRRASTEAYVKGLADVRVTAEPGTRYTYCNICYDTLGLVIEATSGQPYTEYMAEQVFRPLGMSHTYLGVDQPAGELLAKRYAYFFGFRAEATQLIGFIRSDAAVPSGGYVYASLADVARFAASQLGAGPRILSDRALEEGRKPLPAVPGVTMAGFLPMAGVTGTTVLHKEGDGHGSAADLILLPERNFAVVLLVGESSPGFRSLLAQGITQLLLGQEPVSTKGAPNLIKSVMQVSLYAAGVGLLLLVWLLVAVRKTARQGFARGRRGAAAARATLLALVTGLLGYLLLQNHPLPIGYRGYTLDMLIGFGLVMLALLGWLLYTLAAVVRSSGRRAGRAV